MSANVSIDHCPIDGETLDCGHVLVVPEDTKKSGCGGTGYGRTQEGKTRCYTCCLADDILRIARGEPMFAYLSSDGKAVTNWPGGMLMSVTRAWETSAGGFARQTTITRVHARDEFGGLWFGRGPGRGMYIRMRKAKG
jgi:hypothetical protein